MKFLIVDHYFGQDIEALQRAAEGHQIKVVPAALLRKIAQKYFPTSVFASLLGETYALPEYAEARQRYADEARRVLHTLYYLFPFDAIIVPSDTIFYLRAWAPAAHEIGIPFIVLQKETAISPYTMTADAKAIGQALPFLGDLMVVCSEHHKQFWLNTGAETHKIVVTGQSRFDFYSQPEHWQTLEALGWHFVNQRPIVLFLSYDVGAYSPAGVLAPTWKQLRAETETVLIELAQQGYFNVLIKPHPQQQGVLENQTQLQAQAGRLWGEAIQWVSADLDVRQLIINIQVVVGFQTTALLEAMAAGKRVLYTFWTEAAHRWNQALLPFHEMDTSLEVAHSPSELKQLLLTDGLMHNQLALHRRPAVEKQLGPLDGHAAERSLEAIRAFTTHYATQVTAEALTARRALTARAPIYCWRALMQAQLVVLITYLAERLGLFSYPLWRMGYHRRRNLRGAAGSLQTYRSRLIERRRAAQEIITHSRAVLSQSTTPFLFRLP